MVENKIRREQIIVMSEVGENEYSIFNRDNELLINHDEDYFIYFRTATLRRNGEIIGHYLGENPKSIIDEHCKVVKFNGDDWVYENGKSANRRVRMMAVNNKKGVIIIIEEGKN